MKLVYVILGAFALVIGLWAVFVLPQMGEGSVVDYSSPTMQFNQAHTVAKLRFTQAQNTHQWDLAIEAYTEALAIRPDQDASITRSFQRQRRRRQAGLKTQLRQRMFQQLDRRLHCLAAFLHNDQTKIPCRPLKPSFQSCSHAFDPAGHASNILRMAPDPSYGLPLVRSS